MASSINALAPASPTRSTIDIPSEGSTKSDENQVEETKRKANDVFKNVASSHIEPMGEASSETNENTFFFLSRTIERMIQSFHQLDQLPSEEEIGKFVMFCNQFNGKVSDFSREGVDNSRVNKTYMDLVPKMADTLTHLRQFEFALYVYDFMVKNIETYVDLGFEKSQIANLLVRVGGLCLLIENFEEAEKFLRMAIKYPEFCPPAAYTNLVAVCASQKSETKLNDLSEELETSLKSLAESGQSETVSTILFNFGTAYTLLVKDESSPLLSKAEKFYLESLKYDQDNWDSRLHLARVLIVGKDKSNWFKARDMLNTLELNRLESISPFGISDSRKFQIYFCHSIAFALCGDVQKAQEEAVKAGKTRINPDEVRNLQIYLTTYAKKGDDEVLNQIHESIRKIEFDSRIGKFINPKSIVMPENSFVGYHGTIDVYLEEFQNGISPRQSKIRQFKGEGFYIAEAQTREVACYYAMKKARVEGKGEPILLKIHTQKSLVGREICGNQKLKKEPIEYDFIQSTIDGLEAYSQYYIFTHSLSKLAVSEIEKVDWSEAEYQAFVKRWKR